MTSQNEEDLLASPPTSTDVIGQIHQGLVHARQRLRVRMEFMLFKGRHFTKQQRFLSPCYTNSAGMYYPR